MPGVVAFIDHKDIPGKNDCQLFSMFMPLPPREILSTGPVPHVGQTIGAICAETPEQARLAARFAVQHLID
jgi:xanthine dehydrogenase molybdopterin-binding subunit B